MRRSAIFQVEVHDLASLAPLQTFDLSGSTCMTTCPVGGGKGDLTYVATANSVNLLTLIPIEFQVPPRWTSYLKCSTPLVYSNIVYFLLHLMLSKELCLAIMHRNFPIKSRQNED